jgi:hypothetical protein
MLGRRPSAEGSRRRLWTRAVSGSVMVALLGILAWASLASGQSAVSEVFYTTDADFDKGTSVNVNHSAPNNDQLQLNAETSTFPFIWISLSARGTIAKIDTRNGAILGEYSSTSDGDNCHNVSRTTVTLDGSAYAGNRCQSSVIHVGLREANQCIDRNGNGTIETSSGYGDVLPWPGGANSATAPVADAQDECILHYVDTIGGDARHVTANADGDVWVGHCCGSPTFVLIDNDTGTIKRTEGPFILPPQGCGGYGGVIDGRGTLWSATSGSHVLRWEPNSPVVAGVNPRCVAVPNYGLAVDSQDNLWVAEFGDDVYKVSPDGLTVSPAPGQPPYKNGSSTGAQGLAVDDNDHVWVSSSLSCFSNCTLGHLLNSGAFVGNVSPAGNGSTGVAVDSAGKIWTANINGGADGTGSATRIDPDAGPAGAGGVPIGAVDLEVPLPGAKPYNYSDMTGNALLRTTAPQGTWTVVQDGGAAGTRWGKIVWNTEARGSQPPGTDIIFEVRAADTQAGLGGQPFVQVSNGAPFSVTGRFIEVRVTLRPDSQGNGPVLSDLRVCAEGASCQAEGAQTTPPPAAQRARRPRARVAGVPRRCTRSNFRTRVRVRAAAGVRSVRVTLDGRRLVTTRRSTFGVRVPARRLRSGLHRLTVVVRDRNGRRARISRTFRRCARPAQQRPAPVFTG